MKATYFESLYILDVDALKDNEQDNLVMCGSQNWEHYFSVNSEEAHIETLSNVTLLEFETNDGFENFVKQNEIIDYSIEHINPLVLTYGKD